MNDDSVLTEAQIADVQEVIAELNPLIDRVNGPIDISGLLDLLDDLHSLLPEPEDEEETPVIDPTDTAAVNECIREMRDLERRISAQGYAQRVLAEALSEGIKELQAASGGTAKA